MRTSWNWPGSRWWRIDLHTHSPASHDFRSAADRDAQNWAAWASAETSAGLDAVAVTDHNSALGIDAIRGEASAIAGAPVIFPGAEITANDGTHLLFVFDPGCTQQHVEELLTLARIPIEQRGTPDARSPLSVEQLLDLDCDQKVILGAHVNGPAGLLEHDGQQRFAELNHLRLAAVEVDPRRSLDTTWIDGSRREIERVIPQIWCSDSHAFDEAGRRFTWMKMTRPDIEGLRLSLLDGSESLRPAAKEDPGNPNKHADCAIESITVRKAMYMGRSEPLTVELNPWLNAVIGSRGTGKSTLIDLLRATLRREPELNDGGGESSLRASYDKRLRIPPNRYEEGLLTPETQVEVTYRKDGARFVLSWDRQGETQPISRLEGHQRISEDGDIRERFPIRIYSQKQLFDLAKEPHALLTVIDDSAEVRGPELARLIREAETRYLALCAEARALRTQAADLPARIAMLADVRRKLEVLQQGGHAKALNDYRARRQQDGTWDSIQETVIEAIGAVSRAADGNLAVADLDLKLEQDDDAATAALRRAHERLRVVVSNLRQTVLDAVERAHAEIEGVRAGRDAAEWREAVNASEREYQKVISQLAEAGIANPDEYRDLIQRSTALEQDIATREKRQGTADEREREAAAELKRYRELRDELTQRRRQFAGKTSSDQIKVEIKGYALSEGLEDLLRSALSIPRFDDDYHAVVRQIVPTAGQPWDFESLDRLVARLREVIADPRKQWDTQDRRFETALRKLQPERVDRVALILPEDSVEVSFRDPRDANGRWRALAQGSPGQQTAALLAFVLGYGREPIILDQPEDDLDNTLIYELLVRRLRETKPERQILVVTHNPNIVVHGDAELVVSLVSRGGQTQVDFAGGLQEKKAREEICRVMEGGRQAFETRYRRIMLPGGRRDE